MIRNLTQVILHDGWKKLKEVSYELLTRKGVWQKQKREVYDTGDAAAILLYDKERRTLILTKQFRLATYLNQNENGLLLEVCAGKLDKDSPEDCIKREVIEETGYAVETVKKIYEAYIGPGAITEIVYFFIATYDQSMKKAAGGGLEEEGEEIEVLEISFDEAFRMLNNNEIKDAKTIILLQYLKLNEVTLLQK